MVDDWIERICVTYDRITKIKPKIPLDESFDTVTWHYTESLMLDRRTETIEHIQNIGSACNVTRKYEIAEGVSNFLDAWDVDELFSHIVGNPIDMVQDRDETITYKITLSFQHAPDRIIEGSFDKYGLPDDWSEFADALFDFMSFYGTGEILNPSRYEKVKRCRSDYIYCSVEFQDGGKTYYYRTDDETIEKGDKVIVPVGPYHAEKTVRVIDIAYFKEDELPLPLEMTKEIISKADPDTAQEG